MSLWPYAAALAVLLTAALIIRLLAGDDDPGNEITHESSDEDGRAEALAA